MNGRRFTLLVGLYMKYLYTCGVPDFEKCVEDSTFEEFASQNACIVSAIVDGMSEIESESSLDTVMNAITFFEMYFSL